MIKYIKYIETYGLSQNSEDKNKLNVKYPGTNFSAILLGVGTFGEVSEDHISNFLLDKDTERKLYYKYKDKWSGEGRFIYSFPSYMIEAADSKGVKFMEVRSYAQYTESINKGYRLATQEEAKDYHKNILPGFRTGTVSELMIKEDFE